MTPCIEFNGYRNRRGYGVRSWRNRTTSAHRVAWMQVNGPIPDGLCVCHACDNPPCINPEHLFLGTNASNTQDRQDKERQARGERAARSKLTEDEVREIRQLAAAGETQRSIGAHFGVTDKNVGFIVRRQTWAHVQ